MPWLAAAPALVFFFLGRRYHSWTCYIVAALWLIYTIYESSMYLRLLCSGECNIRVDLLIIYPALGIASLIGLIVVAIAAIRDR